MLSAGDGKGEGTTSSLPPSRRREDGEVRLTPRRNSMPCRPSLRSKLNLAAYFRGGAGWLAGWLGCVLFCALSFFLSLSCGSIQVESLQRRQGARILFGVLRSSRRRVVARAVETWRSAAARRVENGRRVHSLVVRTAHRQRVFFLGKAWSRIVWAAGEREAARTRQVQF